MTQEENQAAASGVHEWAVANDVPEPDAFAARYWYFEGKETRLKLAAAFWKYLVRKRMTGVPAIDQD